MSVVPFETQIGHQSSVQCSQGPFNIALVYTEQITERQSALMTECKELLNQYLKILIIQVREIDRLSSKVRYFVIPSYRDDIIKTLREKFDKPIIYLPRAVIEARTHFQVSLPIRSLAVSLTMVQCKIFLVKSCDLPEIKNKIHEMSGSFVSNFGDENLNIVVTDTADNKYCSKAIKRNITVVRQNWVDDSYRIALEEESQFFSHNALVSSHQHKIKPFYGIQFRLLHNSQRVRKLITDNQGDIIYGNTNCLAHIVVPEGYDTIDGGGHKNQSSQTKPRVVDEEFLLSCVKAGYYLSKKEYREYKMASRVVVKKEYPSQQTRPIVETFASPAVPQDDRVYCPIEPWADLPTPQVPLTPRRNIPQQQHLQHMPQQHYHQQQQRQNQCQSDSMNDMIMKALSTFETAQTQQASSQMRRLPDQELRIERTYEPSQQLFWNDSLPRRN